MSKASIDISDLQRGAKKLNSVEPSEAKASKKSSAENEDAVASLSNILFIYDRL